MLAGCQDAVIATADRDSPQYKMSEWKKRLRSVDFCLFNNRAYLKAENNLQMKLKIYLCV